MAEHARDLCEPPDDLPGEDLSSEQWRTSWNDELARRIAEVERGEAELLDGDAVIAEMREFIAK
jgi:hypothetical protein